MSTLPKSFVTPEEYLERERNADYKSEYHDGEILAMSGASRKHNSISWQLQFLVARHIRGRNCHGYTSVTRVFAASSGLYTYPDLAALCDEPQYAGANADTLLNPSLIVEIVSPSTEAYDRGKKARMYRDMPSLKELLLVSQEQFEVELHRRRDDGTWTILNAVGLDSSIELTSIGCILALRELYENVTK